MINLKKSILSAILLLVLSAAANAAEKPEPCDIEFDSMSVKEGHLGETFTMHGKWGDAQGEKLPAINRSKLQPLAVVSWSNDVLTVSIPTSLSIGTHKVGVYCSDPRQGGTYASEWKFFMVKPVIAEADSLAAPERQKRQAGEMETLPTGNNEIGDPLQAYGQSNSSFWILLAGIAAALLLLYYRKKPPQ